mmetsp:Transcript_20584/g.45076  ORF Transcript_20584/g.45076 Transcript_20584/m.45076 type:complete len:228 (-) Transcript_20584:527-1210(-)
MQHNTTHHTLTYTAPLSYKCHTNAGQGYCRTRMLTPTHSYPSPVNNPLLSMLWRPNTYTTMLYVHSPALHHAPMYNRRRSSTSLPTLLETHVLISTPQHHNLSQISIQAPLPCCALLMPAPGCPACGWQRHEVRAAPRSVADSLHYLVSQVMHLPSRRSCTHISGIYNLQSAISPGLLGLIRWGRTPPHRCRYHKGDRAPHHQPCRTYTSEPINRLLPVISVGHGVH